MGTNSLGSNASIAGDANNDGSIMLTVSENQSN